MSVLKKSFQYGQHSVSIETGEVARQASASVVVSMGDTVVLVTAVAAKKAVPGKDFFPLTVNYIEKTYAAGRIPGGFFKREGRPTEKETLTSRLIDSPDPPAVPRRLLQRSAGRGAWSSRWIRTSTLTFPRSSAPPPRCRWRACRSRVPIGASRVGYKNGQYLLNPTRSELKESQLHLVVAGTAKSVLMVESEASGLSEEVMLGAVVFGHEQMQIAIKTINEMVAAVGKPKWDWKPIADQRRSSTQLVAASTQKALSDAYLITEKQERSAKVKEIKAAAILALSGGDAPKFTADDVDNSLFKLESNIVRQRILNGEPRIDGRNATTVRPITVKVGVLPRTHGSALFTRGETQALVATTLGTGRDAQIIDALEGERREPFMFHYNFPPFSVGETGMMGSPKRREIGHGNLARRGIAAMMPDMEKFPYVIRIVSEILESNGSSSMASVCGASLSLMDAGVPIKAPVAGVAMGLVLEGTSASRSSPTSWVTKITWATWTSRSPVRRTASPRCRWTSRSRASRPTS